ncbi:hypothetical protein Tco_0601463 [Tanacetum coccineum]
MMRELSDQVLETDPDAFDGFISPLLELKDHVLQGRGTTCWKEVIKESRHKLVPCRDLGGSGEGDRNLKTDRVMIRCSARIWEGLDGLAPVTMEEHTSSSKSFYQLWLKIRSAAGARRLF